MRPALSVWGWALHSVGAPWVAQRVWAMPRCASGSDRAPFSESSSTLIRPPARRTCSRPASSITATPAESYPRYSSRLSPSTSSGWATFRPTYATIPHIVKPFIGVRARHSHDAPADSPECGDGTRPPYHGGIHHRVTVYANGRTLVRWRLVQTT